MPKSKSEQKETKKIGRPKAVIDWAQFEELCRILCTESEICGVLGVHSNTLNVHCKEHYGIPFSECYKQFTDIGKKSLRRTQYEVAVEDKNPSMLVWLGKSMLGQKEDRTPMSVEASSKSDDGEIKVTITVVGTDREIDV